MDKTLDEVSTLTVDADGVFASRLFKNGGVDSLLLQIIATRPKGARRGSSRRGTAKSHVLGTANSPTTRARAAAPAAAAKTTATPPATSEKIIVSNLPPDVNEVQIRVSLCLSCCVKDHQLTTSLQELFAQTVGPLKEVTLHFDNRGVSKGVASVQFSRKGDGTKAYQQYNNRLIDGS